MKSTVVIFQILVSSWFDIFPDKEKSIFDVWKITLDEAMGFFENIDKLITKVCSTASEIMLGHLWIGQATSTLSDGANIRIKIMKASEGWLNLVNMWYGKIEHLQGKQRVFRDLPCG